MPEIGEVARTIHFVRKHLVGKTLAKVTAIEDNNVFGKVGTSHTEIMKHLTGKKVIDAGQQGKYFWMIMSSPPHPVMHFGMAGWLEFKNEHTYYYKPIKGKEKKEWPPKHWRFHVETKEKGDGGEKIEAAFVDLRRFGRVRLVDCDGKNIRNVSPLVENGPDPVQDKEKVTVEWLKDLCQRKKVPIKAMLLDQGNISGIGNWVGDEIMFDAKMHPEQYANTLTDAQIKQLHKSIHYVCDTAVELLADSDQFPKHWLFKHRWGKGKKDGSRALPTGEKIVFLTVGGRTSAVVPSIQKKTGPVAKEMSEAEEDKKPKNNKTNKRKLDSDSEDEEKVVPKKSRDRQKDHVNGTKAKAHVTKTTKVITKAKIPKVKQADIKDETSDTETEATKKTTPVKSKKSSTTESSATNGASSGRRRSGRLRG